MSVLSEELYRTNRSILDVCAELGIKFNEEDLEDLARCDNCNIWYYEYELIPDTDGLNTCKFCDHMYGIEI